MKLNRFNFTYKALTWALCAVIALSANPVVAAYSIDILPNPTDSDQFVVGPGKTEFILNPGESRTISVMVSNLTGDDRTFFMETEDFTSSGNPKQAVELLGSDRGPYSLRDYISFAEKTFVLKHGERAHIPVTVRVPYDAEPGGLYGATVVSMYPLPRSATSSQVTSQTPIVKRIGSLFYVRVPGEVKEEVVLADFSTAGHKKWFNNGPVNFNVLVENKGSVHAIPKAIITVTNMFGEAVETLEVDSWFVMPASTRLREVVSGREFLLGRYKAELNINLSSENKEVRSVVYWVIPWKLILLIVLVVLILWWSLRWITKNFQIKRKV